MAITVRDLACIMLLDDEEEDDPMLDDEDILLIMLHTIETEKTSHGAHLVYGRFDLADYTEEECKQLFRFKPLEIFELKELLALDERYTAVNGLKFTGLEGFCLVLRRLSYPNRLCDLVPMFGRPKSELSLILNHMLDELYNQNVMKLREVNHNWVDLQGFAEAVHAKGAPLQNIWAFIDGTFFRTSRPVYGQEAVFNGHKRGHGLKYQALMCPNGIAVHFFGPIEGRRHDSALYHYSGLDDLIKNLHDSEGNQMSIFGDSAYGIQPHILTPYKGANLTRDQKAFNTEMSRVRCSVEHGFAKLTSIFAFLNYKQNIKIFLQPVDKYFTVGALLCNAHTCAYDSQIGMYYGLKPPSMKEYFS